MGAATTGHTAVRFTGVTKAFAGGVLALDGVDLRVVGGEFVGVVGPSGCGKSTLLRLAAGLAAPTGGRITVSSDRVGFVFQDPTLLPWRGALANVALPAELRRLPKAERLARARRALETVGLTGFEKVLPAQLSGGMRMRVSLARALVFEPDVFLFDEPFGALDEITRLRLQEELRRMADDAGFSSLFVTHSVPEAVYLADRVVVMSARPGRIVAEIDIPFGRPRPPELRFDPRFGATAAEVSAALVDGAATAPADRA
ncbi:ABC transporter ATP-binding protein [Pseudonocardia eucalypti]|uniref:ABC transporter ATP-binding protein n=1 Tax=Pseudonocardia eucalypti TaxID=648755 RepID=A0ABP9QX16_9PSEU|nr:NitT/TauT family transport system ATP-binding protein [Pseudonocardia eucalypti]